MTSTESAGVTILPTQEITSENFNPYGQVVRPSSDGLPFGPADAQLNLSNGTPRFYIMQLEGRGLRIDRISRHQKCTQCLGAIDGKDWYMVVAPPNKNSIMPDMSQMKAFHIPGDCFIKLEMGTWHAGPYFEHESASFYNLELADTNETDLYDHVFGEEFDISPVTK
ncbi:ureidoglycolate hydrolase [Sphaeroforma arctica JP610]|uniref:Ureidoglycolate hydrolase n=1 Tax=Sphaeroforma arctica JP610 TaxID=667725 RepID=A0A0L0FRL2_9EUKA|nr:ureidoglycolate hydrolase [Sphaeroforma arctica JP610]KNC78603.1 ureidoglycolate hydrolase [Sphaeroforma arctica JP610]|eukprot:XP_014152505.1 ureidoglycolate hydrolase [Sphaeroforma arctica JP610]